jgi:Fe-S-cluster containining protein
MKLKKVQAVAQKQDIPTDGFSAWLRRTRRAQVTDEGASVPCGECRACCTSSYFIHIRPDEFQTLARIPEELLFAAPGLPKGNVLLGYDENGHCPMFIKNQCSIYDYRPQTCRNYDCRIFPATGLQVEDDKKFIAQQARRWQFAISTTQDRKHLSAVQAAAKFLRTHAEDFPPGFVPNNSTQQAVLAIKVYEVFLSFSSELENIEHADKRQKIVEAIVMTYNRFAASERV